MEGRSSLASVVGWLMKFSGKPLVVGRLFR
jgi:hypothetical protein